MEPMLELNRRVAALERDNGAIDKITDQEVVEKVCHIYPDDDEKCAKILENLSIEDAKCVGRENSAMWSMLKNLIAFDRQFKIYCERVVLSPDKMPSRPTTPANVEGPNPKKRKVDSDFEQYPVDGHLAASIGRYALYYNSKDDNYKRCAVPLTPRLIATYRHGDNKKLKKDDEIIVSSWNEPDFKVATRVVKILEELDVIIMESNEDVCDTSLFLNSIVPRKGMRYMMMGYSIMHNRGNHLSFSTGIIASDVTKRSCYTGTSGSYKGDSGGGCWSEDGRLMGIHVAVEKVPHTSDNGRPASPAVGGRCLIVPLCSFEAIIQDLLPKEDSDDEAEWND